jgi:hypothetical protein
LGFHSDPLPVEKSSTLLPKENSPFWFLVRIAPLTQAGVYTSSLSLRKGTEKIITIPIELKVWNFTIPEKPTINIDTHIWTEKVMNFEEGDYWNKSERLEVSKRYYKNVFEHRAKSGPRTAIPVTVTDGHAKTDTTDFEKHVAYLKTLGNCTNLKLYDVLWIPHSGTHQWPVKSKWKEMPIFSNEENTELNPKFVTPFTEHVLQIMDALKRQGCYDHPYIKFFDEPDVTHKPTVNAVTNIAKLLKQINPNIHPASSGVPHRDFMDYFGRWDFPSGGYIPFYEKELSKAREKKAAWVYDNSIPLQDLPLLRVRLFSWMLWQGKFDGAYNWWSITYWNENPWKATKPNSGSLLYPQRNSKEVGPITSLRWEMMRQGLEDYEYLHLLEQLIEANRGKVSPELISKAEAASARVNEVVYRLPVGSNDQPYTLDIALVEEVRNQIAEAIESLISLENTPPSPPSGLHFKDEK